MTLEKLYLYLIKQLRIKKSQLVCDLMTTKVMQSAGPGNKQSKSIKFTLSIFKKRNTEET